MFILGGLAMLFLGGFGAALGAGKAADSEVSGGILIDVAVFYSILAGIYVYPGIKLWKYAGSITALTFTCSERDIGKALGEQRGF